MINKIAAARHSAPLLQRTMPPRPLDRLTPRCPGTMLSVAKPKLAGVSPPQAHPKIEQGISRVSEAWGHVERLGLAALLHLDTIKKTREFARLYIPMFGYMWQSTLPAPIFTALGSTFAGDLDSEGERDSLKDITGRLSNTELEELPWARRMDRAAVSLYSLDELRAWANSAGISHANLEGQWGKGDDIEKNAAENQSLLGGFCVELFAAMNEFPQADGAPPDTPASVATVEAIVRRQPWDMAMLGPVSLLNPDALKDAQDDAEIAHIASILASRLEADEAEKLASWLDSDAGRLHCKLSRRMQRWTREASQKSPRAQELRALLARHPHGQTYMNAIHALFTGSDPRII